MLAAIVFTIRFYAHGFAMDHRTIQLMRLYVTVAFEVYYTHHHFLGISQVLGVYCFHTHSSHSSAIARLAMNC